MGKLFDAMAQTGQADINIFSKTLNDAGIDKMALFSRHGERRVFHNYAEEIKNVLGDKIILGTSKRFNQFHHFSDYYIKEILEELQNSNTKFIGELMFSHADKYDGEVHLEQERYVDSSSHTVSKLMDSISKIKPVPVMFHWEVYHWERDVMSISNMLKKYSNITFLWPHCGFASPTQIDYMLTNHPNLIAIISKREMIRNDDSWISHTGEDLGGFQICNPSFREKVDCALIDNDGIIKPEWNKLLIKHQDRFMWGTDAHKPIRWKSYEKIVNIWRDIFSQLDNNLVKKITYDNAMRVYKINE